MKAGRTRYYSGSEASVDQPRGSQRLDFRQGQLSTSASSSQLSQEANSLLRHVSVSQRVQN